MRNALLFSCFLLLSLVCVSMLPATPLTEAGYGLQTPPPVSSRFDDTTRSYLEPVQDVQDFLAAM